MERFAINILHKRIYKICRLCGVDQPHKIPIIEGAETIIVGDEDEEASLAKKIEECVGIQVSEEGKARKYNKRALDLFLAAPSLRTRDCLCLGEWVAAEI